MLLYNNADGGTSGTTVTANTSGNSGGNSGNYFDTVNIAGTSAAVTFSNAQSAHGKMSYALSAAGTNSSFVIWRASGGATNSLTFASTTAYLVGYFYFATAIPVIGRCMQVVNSGFSLQGGVGTNSSGKLTVVNSAGTAVNTSSTTLPTNSWFRLELMIKSDASVGQEVARIYLSPDSATPTETITTAATINTRGGNISAAIWGFPTTSSTSNTLYLDGLGVSNDYWIGAPDAIRLAQV